MTFGLRNHMFTGPYFTIGESGFPPAPSILVVLKPGVPNLNVEFIQRTLILVGVLNRYKY
jgi:hypothetical protein